MKTSQTRSAKLKSSPFHDQIWERIQNPLVHHSLHSSAASEPEKVKTELVCLPSSQLQSSPLEWSRFPASYWTPEILERWKKWVRGTPDTQDSSSVTFHFPSGQECKILVLNLAAVGPEKTYFLHRTLRETFATPLTDLIEAKETESYRGGRWVLERLPLDDQKRVLSALTFLAETCTWKPIEFRSSPTKNKKKSSSVQKLGTSVHHSLQLEDFKQLTLEAQSLGQANCLTRSLADLPANLLNPKNYREWSIRLAKKGGLKTEFLGTRELNRLGAEAFLAVTRAEAPDNCDAGILKVTYKPSRNPSKKKLALVGKGICFDTGGYNIKTGGGMHGMHGDMTGSALALAMVLHFARTKAPFEVSAHLALAENLISPTGFKPNEIVTACDGTTIEVVDTDAEGRMILADALALVRREKPSLVIDFATLTGAAIRALDTRIAAVFSPFPQLAEKAMIAGRHSGERAWSFPLDADYREGLKSEIADLLQCATHNKSDHIYAASFLAHFIGSETPWLHLDLTPAKNTGGLGLISSSTTGFGTLWTQNTVNLIFREL